MEILLKLGLIQRYQNSNHQLPTNTNKSEMIIPLELILTVVFTIHVFLIEIKGILFDITLKSYHCIYHLHIYIPQKSLLPRIVMSLTKIPHLYLVHYNISNMKDNYFFLRQQISQSDNYNMY